MFGGLKKKLQEAISRVTAPKKEEIEREIRTEEAEQLRAEVKEEIKGLELQEERTRERIERRELEKPEDRIRRIDGVLESRAEKEAVELEKLEEEPAGKKDIEKIAAEEFRKISLRGKEEEEALLRERMAEAAAGKQPEEEKKEKKAEKEKKGLLTGIVRRIAEKTITPGDIENIVKNLETALLESDVALEVAEKICSDVRQSLVGKSVRRGEVEKEVKESLKRAMLDVMQQEPVDIEKMISERKEPLLVMFLGFNGTGKTTNLCKMAYKFKKYNPVLAAGDTFRAASIEQLEEHGRRLEAKVIKHQYGADSAAVIFDAKKHAAASGAKLVLADTAGRSHSNVNLMDELRKVVRVNKPDLKVLVLDSVTGNDIYEQARLFNEAVGVDAMILTKADVYDKGGAALSAAYTLKKPILYLGTGQEYSDLKEFEPEEIVESLLS